MSALLFQHPEIVAVKGYAAVLRAGPTVTLGPCFRHEFTQGARLLARLCLPLEAVLLTRVAHEFLGILPDPVLVTVVSGVFTLRIDHGQQGLHST